MRFLIAILVILLAALALQAGLLAFAMYVLIGVYLLSRSLARRWIENVVATREIKSLEPIDVGDKIEIKIHIQNAGSVPIAWILIEDLLPRAALKQRPPRIRVMGKRLKLATIRAGKVAILKYSLVGEMRGYYQIGPTILETGDLFGLYRRHRVVTKPLFLLVLPKILPLPRYDFASQRPIGEINTAHRLFEDPTRNAGVRPYQMGDPLQRVHWRATARTGELMSRIYETTTLAGATILLDFHTDGYHTRGEPYRSELAVVVAVSLAHSVALLNQPVGLMSNGRDAADRIRRETKERDFATRESARNSSDMLEESSRLDPNVVATRRGIEQVLTIRESLARIELSNGLPFAGLLMEVTPRLPRDATVIAVLPRVSVEASVALGSLRRQGFAITVILIGLEDDDRSQAHGRLLAENIRDVRSVNSEEELAMLGDQTAVARANPYDVAIELV
ncbi:MAG: DUF58 domain-containing protein [Planctomycetes bacterium]|nr:DUF58 domain-containing protein [Planctomycetota bacterium]